jgi:spermidine synthase
VGRRRAAPEVVALVGELAVLRDPTRPTGRLLLQGDMEASYVDLADERHVEFDYLRRMRDLVELTDARRVVHVGGAGCALARALASAHPRHRQEVLEVDPAVLAVARDHLGLRRAPGLRVRVGDGRAALARRAAGSADAVLVDAFVGARVPRRLVTVEAFEDMARVVAPRGLVAVNVVDSRALGDSAAIGAALERVFPHVCAIGPSALLARRRAGNVVLAGAHVPLPLARLRTRAAADASPTVVQTRLPAGEAWRDEAAA